MISFIIIGRNEGWKLTQCLESVFETIRKNDLESYEVIYVDSKSTDDSLERARKFPQVKIFRITGTCNAAIGRNIGAKEAKGDVLFFIDGDMEIQADFLKGVYQPGIGLSYPFLSGIFVNHHYNAKGKLLNKQDYISSNYKDTYDYKVGGIFMISSELWQATGGMSNEFRFNEDIDLALRLAKRGSLLLRKKELIAVHHTIAYTEKSRLVQLIRAGSHLYGIALFRKAFTNKYSWRLFIKQNPTFGVLLVVIFGLLSVKTPWLTAVYFGAVFLRVLQNRNMPKNAMHLYMLWYVLRDVSIPFAFLLFYPQKHFEVYEQDPEG